MKKMIYFILSFMLLVVFGGTFGVSADLAPPINLRIQKDITNSSDVYTCPNCSSAQEWYIDENHVLYWQDNPYVPHAINDFPYQLPFDEQPVEEIIAGIDTLFMQGVSDFYVDFGALPVEFLPNASEDELKAAEQKMSAKLKAIVDHIEKQGGTYIANYSIIPVCNRLGLNLLELLQEGYSGEPKWATVKFMLGENVQQAFRLNLRQYGQLAANSALRAVVFNWEIDAVIKDTPENLAEGLSDMLDIYGKNDQERNRRRSSPNGAI